MIFEAEGAMDAALADYGRSPAEDPIAVGCLAGIARTATAIGKMTVAREALERLEPQVTRWPVARFLLEESRGWLAVGEGRQPDAVGHFIAAGINVRRRRRGSRLNLRGGATVG